jgi:hypothetical protein
LSKPTIQRRKQAALVQILKSECALMAAPATGGDVAEAARRGWAVVVVPASKCVTSALRAPRVS